jgi:hypothetical protein
MIKGGAQKKLALFRCDCQIFAGGVNAGWPDLLGVVSKSRDLLLMR